MISPQGTKLSYALRFNFEMTNNKAEYETLIARLNITSKLKVDSISTFVDSQIIVSLVLDIYEANE